MQHQLPLGFSFVDEISLDSFQVGDNTELLTFVRSMLGGNDQQFLYLWGAKGSGKSHLLQSSIRWIAQQQKPVAYLPMTAHGDISPEILTGLEDMSLVCIDDIECIATHQDWEEAIFHFFNRFKENSTLLIVSANTTPQKLGLKLKDLESRLCWGVTYQVQQMSDDVKQLALQNRAASRGMHLSDEVCQYVFNRYSREPTALFDLLDVLDKASLTAQRKLTIPFIKNHINQ